MKQGTIEKIENGMEKNNLPKLRSRTALAFKKKEGK
jgi:hypothetical protein